MLIGEIIKDEVVCVFYKYESIFDIVFFKVLLFLFICVVIIVIFGFMILFLF